MNMFQRMAWFNLVVVALTAVAGVVLFFLAGSQSVPAAMAVLALFLALYGFSGLFRSRKKDWGLLDEREREILKKSTIIGFSIFWLYYVFTGTILLTLTHSRNFTEYYWIFFLGGILILVETGSAALLILYRLDEEKVGKLLEIGKSITKNRAQQAPFMFVLIMNVLVISPFLYFFPVLGKSLSEKRFALIATLSFGFVFLMGQIRFKEMIMDTRYESYIHRALILSLIGMGASIAVGLCLLLLVYWLFGLDWFNFNRLAFVIFCGFASGILIQPVYILVQSIREPVDASE